MNSFTHRTRKEATKRSEDCKQTGNYQFGLHICRQTFSQCMIKKNSLEVYCSLPKTEEWLQFHFCKCRDAELVMIHLMICIKYRSCEAFCSTLFTLQQLFERLVADGSYELCVFYSELVALSTSLLNILKCKEHHWNLCLFMINTFRQMVTVYFNINVILLI